LLKWILFTLLTCNLFALEISVDSAKENFKNYSILDMTAEDNFICEESFNDFKVVTQIICAFSKKPSQTIRKLQNDFFQIDTLIKDKKFFIVIKPFKKMKLYPIVFNLYKDATVYSADVKISNHWMIVGYTDTIPLIKDNSDKDKGINFPFTLTKDSLPYVGSLDLKDNPVHIKRVNDVSGYIDIKKLYKEKKYEDAISKIDELLEEYPNSLFRAELLFYKIKVYSKLKDFDNVIATSKLYLREYSSDENVPEVLALTARAYSKIGLDSDANYFFDRLYTEHTKSEYTNWGYIYNGEMLEESGGIKQALHYYKKALDQTANIEIAATAAFRLAQHDIEYSKAEPANEYLMKIVHAKPSFFIEHRKESLLAIESLTDMKSYQVAAAIAKAMLDKMKLADDNYEDLLKNRAMWLTKTDDKQEALQALNKYLKTYKYGNYDDIIRTAKDALFFDTNDMNRSAKLNKYNNLISEYPGDSIGNRAIYEKAKLLLVNKMYSDVLGFKESILSLDSDKYSDTEQIIKEAAIGLMKQSLEHKECSHVLTISNEYNITLSNEWDDGVYACAMKGGDFELSKSIAAKNLQSKNIEFRKKWLYRYIKVDFATGNYSDVLDASKDLITLIDKKKDSPYKNIYRILFDTYDRLEKKDELLKYIAKIESQFGVSYKDIERYVAVVAFGVAKKDDTIVIKYATYVMNIQTKSSSYAQSPYIEFTLYQAYINKEDYNQALFVIKSLDKVKLNKTDRARQQYLLGSVYTKLWRDEEAQNAYKQAIAAAPNSAWAKLAQDAKGIE